MSTRTLESLTPQERFFYTHAGYSYNPPTETKEQGRIRCAIALARAETEGLAAGLEAVWEADYDPDTSWLTDEDRPHASFQVCHVYHNIDEARYRSVRPLTSLWGIHEDDRYPCEPYRRVVRAELFAEALEKLAKAKGEQL